jgi:hypothetical protein
MAYTSPTWVNGNSPALNAANLQALTNQVEANQVLYGTIDPTSATQGNLGQHYCNTTTNAVFICTKATSPYAWQEITGALRAEDGTYAGTGTYGPSNPNVLTFSFVPKIVIVATTESASRIPPVVFVSGAMATVVVGGSSTNTYEYTVTWSGKTLSWYVPSSTAAVQLNKSGIIYKWIALG